MSKKLDDLRDQILFAALPRVPADGWTFAAVCGACDDLGLPDVQIDALFPGGLEDVLIHFSDLLDRGMLDTLAHLDPEKLRIRDRIEKAVLARLDAAEPYKDALRLALAYWSMPPRHVRAARVVWRTADRIWDWAGDTATDYNRYTKRGLLAGVMTTTTLVWLKDSSDDLETTKLFLSNRIENVLKFGQIISKFKPRRAS